LTENNKGDRQWAQAGQQSPAPYRLVVKLTQFDYKSVGEFELKGEREMKVKLYSRVKVQIVDATPAEAKASGHEFLYDRVTGKCKVYMPVMCEEELLGEFGASTFVAPNGREYLIVHGPRQDVKIRADRMVQETKVNTFRVEVV